MQSGKKYKKGNLGDELKFYYNAEVRNLLPFGVMAVTSGLWKLG